MSPRIVDHPSPNFTERRGNAAPDMVVLHYTGMACAMAARDRLCDPAAEVSAHYLITEDGTAFALVPEEMRAWHAGRGSWGAVEDVNSHSIGIELANPGHHLGYPPFPHTQMRVLETLLADILERWTIPPERVVGHACIAPGRKIDPGEKFDWARLARGGLAIWQAPPPPDLAPADPMRFAAAARQFGYGVDDLDWQAGLGAVWQSFVMRFLPGMAALPPHASGVSHLEAIAERWPVGRRT